MTSRGTRDEVHLRDEGARDLAGGDRHGLRPAVGGLHSGIEVASAGVEELIVGVDRVHLGLGGAAASLGA
eukprot:3923536-Alexandrium_andersonii.AAC.1